MHYVLSDIHGRQDRFDAILREIGLKPSDHLYVLGDVVDRNPGGIPLLLRILAMPNATLLLGNHELMMRECLTDGCDCADWIVNGGMVTLMEYFSLAPGEMKRLCDALESLPVEAEVTAGGTDYVLAHAAPRAMWPMFLSGDGITEGDKLNYITNLRIEKGECLPDGRTLVFGHTPTVFYQEGEPPRVWRGDRLIGIDCGCASPAGRLACVRLEDGKVFYSDGSQG